MDYHCSYIKEEYQEAWEKLVQQNPYSGFHQSFDWASFKRDEQWDTYKIGLFTKKKELIAGAVIHQFTFSNGTNFLYIPEGPVINYKNEQELKKQWKVLRKEIFTLADSKKDMKTTHLRIEPRADKLPTWFFEGFEKASVNLQPKYTQVINLETAEEEILAAMKQKGRYNIKVAKKHGVKVTKEQLNEATLNSFYSLYKQTFKRNKFEGKGKKFFDNYQRNCSEFSKVFMAHKEDQLLAAAIMVYYGDRVTYLYGASSTEYRKFMAPYLLHFQAMIDGKNQGFKEYDFWGIARDAEDKEHDWHGITRFKKQFGGEQKNFLGAFDYVFKKELYEEFLSKHES